MRIDNSQAKAFRFCPLYWREKYLIGIEKVRQPAPNGEAPPAEVGTRTHQLLEEHYRPPTPPAREPYPEHPNATVEAECQLIMAAYRSTFPVESFSVVAVEHTFEVPLGERHTYVGKFDGIIRDADGHLCVLEHKSEKRTSKANNPKAWAARNQGALYLWAAEQVYGEPFECVVLNVLRRPSPKGQEPPEFPPRQNLFYSAEQRESAVDNLLVTADEIEEYKARFGTGPRDWWPSNTENCYNPWPCEFVQPHVYGWSDELLKQYKSTTPYLDL